MSEARNRSDEARHTTAPHLWAWTPPLLLLLLALPAAGGSLPHPGQEADLPRADAPAGEGSRRADPEAGDLGAGDLGAADEEQAAQEAPSVAGPEPQTADQHRSLIDAYRTLVDLREGELGPRAAALLESAPGPARDALLLRAGADLPPGATSAQRAQHAALAGEALTFLRQRAEGDPGRAEELLEHIRLRLAHPRTEDLLWSAAARVAGELRLYEVAGELGAGLGSGRPQRETSARAALHRLFVRWFASREDFETYWAALGGAGRAGTFYDDLVDRDRVARERLLELLELDAARALASLADPDPRVRAAAARSSARAVAARRAEAAPVSAALAARLELERAAQPFHAQLEALLELLAGSPPEAHEWQGLRRILLARIDERHQHLAPSIAHGLARMPRGANDSAAEEALERGIGGVASLVLELSPPGRPVQPEALVAVLQSARTLFGRAQEVGLDVTALARPVRARALALLADPAEVRSVRLVSAQLLARIARAEDIAALTTVLEGAEGGSADLCLSLLGTLAALARQVGPDDEGGARVLSALERHLDSPLADLRGRALGLLLEEGMEPFAARADVDRVVKRLDEETSGEVAGQLLAFLARHGGAGQLAGILASPAVDRLVLDSARRARLLETLARLAGGDPERVLTVVERLLAVEDSESRLRRLQQGLQLVAALEEERAAALAVARHDQIVAWAMELRAATGARFELGGAGTAFLHRLFRLHMERASPADPADGVAAHVRGVLLADLHASEPSAAPSERVLEAFDRALRLADTERGAPLERVLRDRARFRFSILDLPSARRDYERALDVQRAAVRAAQPELAREAELGAALARAVKRGDLDLGDLRRAAGLLRNPTLAPSPPPEGSRLAIREAFDVAAALLEEPVWRLESAAVRVADLELVVELALAGGEPGRLERARSLLADLPPLPEPDPSASPTSLPAAPSSEASPWNGLVSDRALHTRLLEAQERLQPPRPTEAAAPSPAEPPPADQPPRSPDPPSR